MAWWFRRKRKKGTTWQQLQKDMRAAGMNPEEAYCPECGEWYNPANIAAFNKHAH